jgi:ribosomal protein S18 acetylase RimI-like enzyme
MGRIEFQPAAGADPARLAPLLDARHRAHQVAEPLLAPVDAEAAVLAVLAPESASGVVAVRGDEVVGFLVAELRENELWGHHAWVDYAGHAAAADPELVRDMYAAAAPAWIEAGARLHLPLVPALGELLDPWYRLGFGQMQQHAIRASGGREPVLPDGVTIRAAGKPDLERVADELGAAVWDHQMLAPTFSGARPRDPEQVRSNWLEVFEDPTDALFLAERGGELLGHVLLYRAPPTLGVPEDAVNLSLMAVAPAARGQGVGVALSDHACRWAAESGYGSITIDWRVANLLSSRFWVARGFRPAFLRLNRMVGIG